MDAQGSVAWRSPHSSALRRIEKLPPRRRLVTLEVPAQPRSSWAAALLPSCEILSRSNVQLFLARIYEPPVRGHWVQGRESEGEPDTDTPNTDQQCSTSTPPTRTSSAQRAPPRPNGNRSPPLARALPAPRVLRWTLLAACGPDQARRNHARRGSHSLSPRSSAPTPAERDRDAPSAPVVLPRTAPGRVRRRPPRRGTLRRRAARLRRRAPETLFLKPCPCVARAPGDTDRHCWKRAGPKPSPVTRPRPGYGATPLLGRPSSAPPTSGATSSRCRTRSGPQRHRPPC